MFGNTGAKNNEDIGGSRFENLRKEIDRFKIEQETRRLSEDLQAHEQLERSGRLAALNVDRYFEKNHFVPKRLGDELKDNFVFVTLCDSMETFYYEDGVYLRGAEGKIHDYCASVLGEKYLAHRVNEVVNYVKDSTIKFFKNRREIKEPINLLPLANGIINLDDSNALIPHDPKYLFFTRLPIIYDPDAGCPHFLKWLSEVQTEENVPLIQEILGYVFWRTYVFQNFFVFTGKKWNGKSTLMKVIRKMLGEEDGCCANSLAEFEYNRFAKAELYEKYANLHVELTSKNLEKTNTLKALTGGDMVKGEEKHKKPFYFENYAKIIISTNQLPRLDDSADYDEAFFRRCILINFPYEFPPDKQKPQNTLIEEFEAEFPGILNWALKGLTRLRKNGKFSYNLDIDEVMEKWHRLNDSIACFALDCLKYDVHAEPITNNFLWRIFLYFCEMENLSGTTQATLTKRLPLHLKGVHSDSRRRGLGVEDKKSTRCWLGVDFRVDPENKPKMLQLLKFISTKIDPKDQAMNSLINILKEKCDKCSDEEEGEGGDADKKPDSGLKTYLVKTVDEKTRLVLEHLKRFKKTTSDSLAEKTGLELAKVEIILNDLWEKGLVLKTEQPVSGVIYWSMIEQGDERGKDAE